MKIVLTADVHVGVPGRLNDIMWALRRIRQYCRNNSISHIMILGDLLHDREQIRVEDLNALVDFLIETDEKYQISIISFPGNHDMFLKNSWEINSLRPLARYITSYHEPTNTTLGGVRFWILPFIHYESDYMRALANIHKEHKPGDVLLTHIGVKSATLNSCFLLKSWSIVDFSDSLFDRIYTGHFHVHQQVGNNVWYPGSPLAFKFDEGDCDHGFLVFDTETRTHEFVNLWDGATDAPPQYKTIDDASLRGIKPSDVRDNIVRIALSKEYTHNQLSIIRRSLQKMGAKDVRWMNLAAKEEKQGMEVAQAAASSIEDLFDRFLEADKDNIKDLNVDILKRFNKEVMADAERRYMEQAGE